MPCNSVGDTEHSYSDYPVSRGSGPALRSVAPSHSDCVAWTFHFRDLRAFQLDVSELAGHSCHSGSLAFAIAPVYNTPPPPLSPLSIPRPTMPASRDTPSKSLTPQRKHRKLLKDGSSEVWPEDIERIFVQGPYTLFLLFPLSSHLV